MRFLGGGVFCNFCGGGGYSLCEFVQNIGGGGGYS